MPGRRHCVHETSYLRDPLGSPRGRAARRPSRSPRLTAWFGDYRTTPSRVRLASVPDMFGDIVLRGGVLTALETDVAAVSTAVTTADLPLAGGVRGLLVAEHNKALPVDRIYFNYNHYRHPIEQVTTTSLPVTVVGNKLSLDRYTCGWEQTFHDGCSSLEIRLPLASLPSLSFDVSAPAVNDNVSMVCGDVGNVSLIFKRIVYENCDNVLSAGLGVEVPTGSDASAIIGRTRYDVHNDAVHLAPFVALMQTPNDLVFRHAFIQLDVPTNGNRVSFTGLEPGGAVGSYGKYNEQNLLHFNVSGGVWLLRDKCRPLCTGVAALAELHYTTTLQGPDVVTGSRLIPVLGPDTATFTYGSRLTNLNVVNATTGVHVELANDTNLRVAGVFPLTSAPSRYFDAELSVQLSRKY